MNTILNFFSDLGRFWDRHTHLLWSIITLVVIGLADASIEVTHNIVLGMILGLAAMILDKINHETK